MPTFEFLGTQADGQETKGIIYGSSLDSALAELQKQGVSVHSLRDPNAGIPAPTTSGGNRGGTHQYQGEVGAPPTEERSYFATSVAGPLVGKVGLSQISFFFTQLATMLEAGVPIVQSLDTLATQNRDIRFKAIISELKGHVEAGRPMSIGMQRYPEVFTPVMVSLIRTGEEGGFLDRSLHVAAKYVEDEIEIRSLYRRVTIYPKILVVLSMFIILGTNFILGAVNASANKLSSPLTTWTTWIWLGPLLIGMFLFFRVGLANFAVKAAWDRFVCLIPYVGKTTEQMAMTKFGRSFGAMYQAGVPLPKAIQLAADGCGNEYIRSKIYPAIGVLERGGGITETLASTGALNPLVLNMLATGERTGNIDQMLNKVADYFHQESKTRSIILGYVTGVVILLCVAIYIGYIVVSFWSGYGSGVTNMLS